jgi:hypothetical protein
MDYYIVLPDHEMMGRVEHDGVVHVDGIDCSQEGVDIVDPSPPSDLGVVQWVGLYFAAEDVLTLLHHGPCIRKVTVPEGARIAAFRLPKGQIMYRADKIRVGPRIELTDETIGQLVDEGANVDVNEGLPIRQAIRKGDVARYRKLLAKGANPRAKRFEGLRTVVEQDKPAMVSELLRTVSMDLSEKDKMFGLAMKMDRGEIASRLVDAGASFTAQTVVAAAFNGGDKVFAALNDKLSPQEQHDVAVEVDARYTEAQTPPDGIPAEEYTPPIMPAGVQALVNSQKPF